LSQAKDDVRVVAEITAAPADISEAVKHRQLIAFRKFLEELREHRTLKASPDGGRLRHLRKTEREGWQR